MRSIATILLLTSASAVALAWFVAAEPSRDRESLSSARPAEVRPSPPPSEAHNLLLGRWLRPDGGYLLTIRHIDTDGRISAEYANPRPVPVARAQLQRQSDGPGGNESQPTLLIELRGPGYPGNLYLLQYDANTDQLHGTYQHLGINQTFQVRFVRAGVSGATERSETEGSPR